LSYGRSRDRPAEYRAPRRTRRLGEFDPRYGGRLPSLMMALPGQV